MIRPTHSSPCSFGTALPTAALLVFLAAASTLPVCGAQEDVSMEDFPVMLQRNIFDPTRRPNQVPERPAEPPERPPEPLRRETLSLTGSFVRPDSSFAFFSSSNPDLSRVVSPEDQLGDFVVTDITTTNVVLRAETNQWSVRVGRMLTRQGDGPWTDSGEASPEIEAPTGAASVGTPAGTDTDSDGSTSGDPPAEGEMSDLMKRLMERRQQELAQ